MKLHATSRGRTGLSAPVLRAGCLAVLRDSGAAYADIIRTRRARATAGPVARPAP
jgi:hypothetical protein